MSDSESPLDRTRDAIERPDSSDSSSRVYVERSNVDRATDLLESYRYILAAGLVAFAVAYLAGYVEVPEVPPEAISYGKYAAVGSIPGSIAAYALISLIEISPRGVEVLDLDPVSGDIRHLRIGPSLWEGVEVRTPYGEEVDTSSLKRVSINGRTGVECMDMRADPDRGLVCVSTHLGEMSSVELRTYRSSLSYAQTRLSERANEAVALRANMGGLVREGVERITYEMVRESETSGVPHGDRIEEAVEDIIGSIDLDSEPDLGDSGSDLDREDIETIEEEVSLSQEPVANGGDR